MNKLRYTVIGASGTIGRAVSELLPPDIILRAVSRSGCRSQNRAASELISADVSNSEAIAAAVSGSDVVILSTTSATDDPSDLERDIVGGADVVAAACRRHNVPRLVFISSISALFLGRKHVITEVDGIDDKPQRRNYYARYKIEAERIFQEQYRSYGLPVVTMRPGLVLGGGSKIAHGGLGNWAEGLNCLGFGSGKTPLPFVLARDVAQAVLAASVTPGIEGTSFNIVGDVFLSALEFFAILRKRSLRQYRFHPNSNLRYCLQLNKWAVKMLSRNVRNRFPWRREISSMRCTSRIDCGRAKELLNWRPNDNIETFLREAIDFQLPVLSPFDPRFDNRQEEM